ncbi:hypothetical protein BUZ45_11695, partial [Staphylococcus hominis]
WYANVWRGAKISRNVFWPVPNVDSALVHMKARPVQSDVERELVFGVVDAAFAQRRKTLRAALGAWIGSPARAEEILAHAGIDFQLRGERLTVDDFIRIAQAFQSVLSPDELGALLMRK